MNVISEKKSFSSINFDNETDSLKYSIDEIKMRISQCEFNSVKSPYILGSNDFVLVVLISVIYSAERCASTKRIVKVEQMPTQFFFQETYTSFGKK